MNFQTQRREPPELTMTPLIDVVFLLLIFFMVSTTFRRETDLQVALPTASQPATAEQQGLEVIIDGQGDYYINDQPLADNRPQTLRQVLETLAGKDRNQPLTIRADATTPLQAVITVMDIAKDLELQQLAIKAIQTPKE